MEIVGYSGKQREGQDIHFHHRIVANGRGSLKCIAGITVIATFCTFGVFIYFVANKSNVSVRSSYLVQCLLK